MRGKGRKREGGKGKGAKERRVETKGKEREVEGRNFVQL